MTTTTTPTLPAELQALARIATEAGRHVEASAMRRAGEELERAVEPAVDALKAENRLLRMRVASAETRLELMRRHIPRHLQ